jgi:hypothetical protein
LPPEQNIKVFIEALWAQLDEGNEATLLILRSAQIAKKLLPVGWVLITGVIVSYDFYR